MERVMLKSVQLGNSGLRVSELCLGTMNFGKPGRGHQGDWTLTEEQATPIFKTAIDCGLFYFDCADVYGLGASEEVVGSVLRKLLPRDEYASCGAPLLSVLCCLLLTVFFSMLHHRTK